jgi:hypothetical protein
VRKVSSLAAISVLVVLVAKIYIRSYRSFILGDRFILDRKPQSVNAAPTYFSNTYQILYYITYYIAYYIHSHITSHYLSHSL